MSVKTRGSKSVAAPSPMAVYDGTRALGEIEDYARGDVRAFVGIGDDRVIFGIFPDRRAAMRAVSEAAKAPGASG
jgi:hypothetical protein